MPSALGRDYNSLIAPTLKMIWHSTKKLILCRSLKGKSQMEEWKECYKSDYATYSISNQGRVRNDTRGNILAPRTHNKGYLAVSMGKGKQALIHRLVATAFLPNPEGYPDVDHKNRDKKDNRVENLRWISHSNNMLNSDRVDNASYISYLVSIRRNGEIHRGIFKTEAEAIEFRDRVLRENPIPE